MIFYEHFPSNLVYFFLYDFLNKKFSDYWDRKKYKSRYMIPVFTSFLSELAIMSFYVPMDTIMTRMQSHDSKYNYKSVWDGLSSIYQKEGMLRFYFSSHLFIVYSLIFTTIQFSSYEWLKAYYQHKTKVKEFKTLESCIATIMSTSMAVLLSHPADTIVIQHQMINFETEVKESTLSLLRKEYEQHKWRIFTRSIGLRMMSWNAAGLAILPIYEYLRQKYHVEIEL